MRLTDLQVRDTVAAAKMAESEKQVLLKWALANDPSARLVVFAKWRQGQAEGVRS